MAMQMLQEAQQIGLAAAIARFTGDKDISDETKNEQLMLLSDTEAKARAAHAAHALYHSHLAYLVAGTYLPPPPPQSYHASAALMSNWIPNGIEREAQALESAANEIARTANGAEWTANGMERAESSVEQAEKKPERPVIKAKRAANKIERRAQRTPSNTDTNTSTSSSAPTSPPDSPTDPSLSPATDAAETPLSSVNSPLFGQNLITPPTTQQRGQTRRLSECSSENFDSLSTLKRQCKIPSSIPVYTPSIDLAQISVNLFTPTGPMSPPSSGSSTGSTRGKDRPRRCDGSRDKNFKCKICLRCFGYKHVLQNHERTHTGEKPFECRECHKRFTRDHHLKTHMRLHTGEKPYHCEHCDRQFVQVANLRRHLRVHTGERPYKCDRCKSNFSDSNQLKAHLLTHTNEKPLECKRCHAKFRLRELMAAHKCDLPERMGYGRPDKSPFIRSPSTDSPAPVFSPEIIGSTGASLQLPSFAGRKSFKSEESVENAINLNPTPHSSDDQDSRNSGESSGASTVAANDQPLDLSDDGSANGRLPPKAHEPQLNKRASTSVRFFDCQGVMPIQTEPEDLSLRPSPTTSSPSSPASPTDALDPRMNSFCSQESPASIQSAHIDDMVYTHSSTSSKLITIFENARESECNKNAFLKIEDAADLYEQQHHQRGEHPNLKMNTLFFA